MNKNTSIFSMLMAIILMATPFGVAMTFATSPTERVTDYFSYFSMMPLGYGNWFPMIIAILSIIAFVLLIIGANKTKIKRTVQVLLSICIAASALSWIIFSSFSIVGACVMVIHIVVLALQILQNNSRAI